MYDEAFHAPLSYFNPKALQSYKANKKAPKFKLKEYYVSTLNNNDDFDPEPILQKFTDVEPAFDDDYSVDLGIQGQSIPLYSNTDIKRISSMTPLDIATLHSITRLKDLDLMKKYFSNIILIGGGALVPGFSNTLQDRILSLASQTTNGAIEKVEVLSGARELDPRLLCWKGGSIFSRLESCQEVLINSEEFNLFGLEGAKEKLVFNW
jgi:actin-related protein 8